ncbi:hypothetical protein JCM16303_000784 [Sporobolomyces ruberrimus]
MSTTPICTAQTSYKKRTGVLSLDAAGLTWTNPSTSNPELSILSTQMTALFASKEGGPRVMLKIAFNPLPPQTDDSYNFTFTSAATALSDRERFKGEISTIIARNREREAQIASNAAAAAGTQNGTSTAGGGQDKGKGKAVESRANDQSGGGANTLNSTTQPSSSTTTTTATSQGGTFRLRKQILQSSPQLLSLHRELVLSGQLTEQEFWQGREQLLESLSAEESLMRGKSGEMVDPKTVTGQNGQVTVKITPGLIREIFEEFPVVLRAYNDNVPQPLDEAQFWTRYFQSKLFNRNRTTNRAAVDSIRDDAIFDKYLGQEDDDVTPQHEQDHDKIYKLLDLAATEEDQHEITNLPRDFTMKAGGQRASLPLMRRFNEHSERLLSQALGSADPNAPARTYVDPGNAGDRRYYSEIELSDLSTPRQPDRVALNLSSIAGSSNPSTNATSVEKEDGGEEGEGEATLESLSRKKERERAMRDEIVEDWEGRLDEFKVDSGAVREGMRDMMGNIELQTERNRKTGGSSLPRAQLLTVESISTTTLEFLRHFWSSILPPKPNDVSAFAMAPAKERAARAEKFKGYLEKSRERIRKALEDAEVGEGGRGEVRKRVEAALEPISNAIDAAVEMYKSKLG